MINKEILLDAAKYIEEHGWRNTGGYGEEGGPRCLLGAIKSTLGVANVYSPNWEEYFNIWEDLAILWHIRPEIWNDHVASNAEEVITRLRTTAQNLP